MIRNVRVVQEERAGKQQRAADRCLTETPLILLPVSTPLTHSWISISTTTQRQISVSSACCYTKKKNWHVLRLQAKRLALAIVWLRATGEKISYSRLHAEQV